MTSSTHDFDELSIDDVGVDPDDDKEGESEDDGDMALFDQEEEPAHQQQQQQEPWHELPSNECNTHQ